MHRSDCAAARFVCSEVVVRQGGQRKGYRTVCGSERMPRSTFREWFKRLAQGARGIRSLPRSGSAISFYSGSFCN